MNHQQQGGLIKIISPLSGGRGSEKLSATRGLNKIISSPCLGGGGSDGSPET